MQSLQYYLFSGDIIKSPNKPQELSFFIISELSLVGLVNSCFFVTFINKLIGY